MDGFKKECKLCDDIISNDGFKLLDDGTKNIFDVLLLKLTLDTETQNVMCMVCSTKLLAAFNFKSACLDRDKTITVYVDSGNPKPVDLKEIYENVTKNKQVGGILDDREICRLCLDPTSREHKSIQEVPVDTIRIYVPEINFTVSTNPVTCIKCHEALCVHSSFIKNCLEVEKKRNTDAMDFEGIPLINPSIKTEEIEIKPEPVDEETIFEILNDIKKEEHEEGDTSSHSQSHSIDSEQTKSLCTENTITDHVTQVNKSCGSNRTTKRRYIPKSPEYQCDQCEYNTRHSKSFTQHQLLHKDPSKVQVYACDKCDYKGFRKAHLESHQVKHKNPSESPIYKCEQCDYTAMRKDNLSRHRAAWHTDPSKVRMYKCGKCDFKSFKKAYLDRHHTQHKDHLQARMFECNSCSFKSRHRRSLDYHQLRHKDPSNTQSYMCDKCDYKSIRKDHFNQHQLRHEEPSQVQKYSCDVCHYKSIQKDKLKRHKLIHKDPSTVQMYTCDQCDYKSLEKGNVTRHQLKHIDRSKVQKYECDQCDYKGVRKDHLKQHQLRHRDLSELHVYRCTKCDYKSITKGDFKRHLLKHKDLMQEHS